MSHRSTATHPPRPRVRPTRSRGLAVLVGVCLASGCASRVRLVSIPAGATFEELDPETGELRSRCLSPCETRMVRRPGRPVPWRAVLPGREPLTFDLMRTEGRVLRWIGGALFQQRGREVTVMLVPTREPLVSAEAP